MCHPPVRQRLFPVTRIHSDQADGHGGSVQAVLSCPAKGVVPLVEAWLAVEWPDVGVPGGVDEFEEAEVTQTVFRDDVSEEFAWVQVTAFFLPVIPVDVALPRRDGVAVKDDEAVAGEEDGLSVLAEVSADQEEGLGRRPAPAHHRGCRRAVHCAAEAPGRRSGKCPVATAELAAMVP